jgi:putative membrane protein
VASSIFILRGIKGWNLKAVLFLILGVILGVTVCTLSPTTTPDALWFIFISGAIAICAMILPGISGSFILLILGKYQYIMSAITGLTSGEAIGESIVVLGVFAVGAVCGILSFSRFLHWLLGRFHKETLITLAGFIIGSLVKVWPWNDKSAIVQAQFPEAAALANGPITRLARELYREYYSKIDMQIESAIIFALIGFCLVTGIEIVGKMISKKKAA